VIIGSGLIATAFSRAPEDWRRCDQVVLYAAGVSNSRCEDPQEFLRDQRRIEEALAGIAPSCLFAYFSTCSIYDPSLTDAPYVAHKRAIEALVQRRQRHVIFRLPQVVGISDNPHTLLNHIHARLAKAEPFQIWGRAKRNFIDVDDAVSIVSDLITTEVIDCEVINVANPRSSPMTEVVVALERSLGVAGSHEITDAGSAYAIDVSRISSSIKRCSLAFDELYLHRLIEKYYGVQRGI
jgi:nucleoside-diphosphate-sugar epimerase